MTQPKLAQLSLWGAANGFHEGRAYRDPRDGKQYPSITTALKGVPKDLTQYAADQQLKWCIDNWQFLGGRSDESAFRGARYRWRDHADLRGHVGDGIHNYIEAEQTGSWDFPELDAEQQQILANWHELNEVHKIEPLRNEVTVVNREVGYMGTFDSYCKIDGVPTMVDFKGLALDTPIPTPTGWTTMADLRVGDTVFDAEGRPTVVTGKSGIHYNPSYEISFDDGSSVICDEDHRWVVNIGEAGKTREVVMTVREILQRGLRGSNGQRDVRVRKAAAIDLPAVELPIDPYVLGAWLGDGTSENGGVTKPLPELWAEIGRRGFEFSQPHGASGKESSRTRTVYGLRTLLRKNDLLANKHVPDIYFRSSAAQRLDLLRGLMDTDGGYNSKRRRFAMTSTSRWQVDAVAELVRSLGWRARISEHDVTWTHGGEKRRKTGYSVEFSTDGTSPFLVRASEAHVLSDQTDRGRYTRRMITDIRPTAVIVPTQCIEVDSPSSTYLCTRDFIPTHNTSKNVYDSAYMQLAALVHGEHWLIEVEEMRWEAIEPEPIEAAAVFHLRSDKWAIHWVNDLDLHWRKFVKYVELFYVDEALKRAAKDREKAS